MQAVAPYKEAADIIKEEGGDILKLCYQCGLCSGTCPWNLVKSFIVRRIMHQGQLGLIDFEDEDMWQCATCRACVQVCPRGVEIIDVMRAVRRAISEFGVGKVPESLRISMKNIAATGNPLGEPQENRADWAKDLDVKPFTAGTEVLYFVGCYAAYDPSIRRVARATVNILNKAGVDFGILGNQESCCGESARKAGHEELFQSLAQGNIDTFKEAGVTKVITTSPHCYHTFKNEYPELGADFEVIHFSQYLAQLITDGRIKPTKEVNKVVTYHDPCYLGRHNDIYDEPREVLGSIPGLKLVEMPDNRELSLCCGGGGGQIWMDVKKGERLTDLRLDQALTTEAKTLVVACPYCMLNLEDSALTSDKGEAIEIKDIAELVLEAI